MSCVLLVVFSLYFGVITCVTGVLGVWSGVELSRWLRLRTPRADPLVCAAGLLVCAPFLYLAIVFAQASTIATYVSVKPAPNINMNKSQKNRKGTNKQTSEMFVNN